MNCNTLETYTWSDSVLTDSATGSSLEQDRRGGFIYKPTKNSEPIIISQVYIKCNIEGTSKYKNLIGIVFSEPFLSIFLEKASLINSNINQIVFEKSYFFNLAKEFLKHYYENAEITGLKLGVFVGKSEITAKIQEWRCPPEELMASLLEV